VGEEVDGKQVAEESPTEVVLREGVQSAPVGGSRVGNRRRTGLERQFSLEHSYHSRPHTKVHVPKRPNTSGGTSTENLASPDPAEPTSPSTRYQSPSPSTPAADSIFTDRRAVSPSPRPHIHAKLDADDNSYLYPLVRSQSPDLSSLVVRSPPMDTDSPPLSRVSTAPTPAGGGGGVLPGRDARDHARHIASASKLTRMGFATPDASGTVRPPAGSKRFGLKSLMHSLTGKS